MPTAPSARIATIRLANTEPPTRRYGPAPVGGAPVPPGAVSSVPMAASAPPVSAPPPMQPAPPPMQPAPPPMQPAPPPMQPAPPPMQPGPPAPHPAPPPAPLPAAQPAPPAGTYASASRRHAVSAPRRLRHPGSVVPPLVLRLLLAQAVVALAVAAAAAHSPLLWALAGLGAVVLVPSVLVSRRFGVRMRYRMRARTVKSRTGDLRSGLLEHLDPSTVIDSIEVDGDRVGVVATDTGAVAVLELGG